MLTLYIHPLASFCHKVLISLYESELVFEARTVDFSDPGSAAAHFERWPVGKIPVLHDSATGRVVPETSIIIEYLQTRYPEQFRFLPDDARLRLDTRLWDRFYDLHVSVPMQKIVRDRIRPAGAGDPYGVAEAHEALETAYAMIETQLSGKAWAVGDDFTLADCAAFPALFFASVVHPIGGVRPALSSYLDRLLSRPSVARVLDEARPF
ncbi:glutathione S-transferase family protein [Ensifer sp. NM-2]|uniref:glutathione S-transferase family protein n=1 Tax=Ensifer sp. Root31 TaxID=1736512 RepID=UPI00070D43EE|nr:MULTISPECIES: glutathione S-transferase family protein [unclassified Ensifer]KQU84882.1 glutathione S-transferase [Ensifer sp. Root31]PSS64248.1 glutathione S-transferase family protein [Ensifer sp. NM-2]